MVVSLSIESFPISCHEAPNTMIFPIKCKSSITNFTDLLPQYIRGLLEKYPTFGREKETGLLGALDT